MAFSGTMGASSAMIPVGVLRSPDGGTLSYDTNGTTLLKAASGTVTALRPPRIDNLRLIMEQDQNGPVLQQMAAGVSNPVNGDTGALTTKAPGAGEHGIPDNFGPGRGNWTQADVDRVRARVVGYEPEAGAAGNVGGCQVSNLSLVGSDLGLLVRNTSLSNATRIVLDLEYLHSMDIG